MSLLALIVVVCLLVFALWAVNTYLSAPWKMILTVVLVLVIVLLALSFAFPALGNNLGAIRR